MTAYLVFDAIKKGALTPDSKITYSDQADAQVPSKLGLPIGAQLSVETALKVLIIKSANDVAVMLAEGVAGFTAPNRTSMPTLAMSGWCRVGAMRDADVAGQRRTAGDRDGR